MSVTCHPLIACTRMYNASPAVTKLWTHLIGEAGKLADVDLAIIAHAFPNNIEDLWNRPDLGLGFMCGRAFMLGGATHLPVAVPLRGGIAADGVYENAPLYHTEFLVKEDSPFERLEDTFEHRLGWTVHHSHSGHIAVREHLARFTRSDGRALYAAEVGPLHTPARCLEALQSGEADVVPMDAYYRDLLVRNTPEILTGMRSIGSTRAYPMPLLVTAPGSDPALGRALREGLAEACRRGPGISDRLCISGFTEPDLAAYMELTASPAGGGQKQTMPPAAAQPERSFS